MKVWVVSSGEYSDYGIEAVFLSEEEASRFRDKWNAERDRRFEEARVEEYPIGDPGDA